MSNNSEKAEKAAGTTNALIKGNKMYHTTQGHRYQIKVNSSPKVNCKVNVIDKLAKTNNGRPDWVFRLDKAHKGAEFNHVNINPKISGMAKDPHVPLPKGTLTAGKGVAKTAQVINKINKVAIPLAIAVDTVQTGVSVYKDCQQGTSRNTVETLASVAGGWGGGYGGAVGGAALGSMIFPGIGTIVGGIVGGLAGGIGGSMGAEAAVSEVGDLCDYDVEEYRCKRCDKKFKVRKYLGEKHIKYCESCR